MIDQTRMVQKHSLDILKEIIKICNEHNLTYFLVGGSALGAYRHSGFIPWDDDIDIGLPRKDYNEFIEIAKTKLSPNFYLQDVSTTNTMIYPYAKIRKRNTAFVEDGSAHIDMHYGIFVDIFPLDNIPNNKIIRKYQKIGLRIATIIKFSKMGYRNFKWWKKIILNLIDLILFKNVHAKLYNYFMNIGNKKNTRLMGNLVGAYSYEKEAIEKEIFGKGKIMLFEGIECIVPEKIEDFLCHVYGSSYNELPPIDQRITHSPIIVSFEREYSLSDIKEFIKSNK